MATLREQRGEEQGRDRRKATVCGCVRTFIELRFGLVFFDRREPDTVSSGPLEGAWIRTHTHGSVLSADPALQSWGTCS